MFLADVLTSGPEQTGGRDYGFATVRVDVVLFPSHAPVSCRVRVQPTASNYSIVGLRSASISLLLVLLR